jgi:gamma-glutamyltranspeptidase/glutathione hydrolase
MTALRQAREDLWADRLVGETADGFGFQVAGHANEMGHQAICTPGFLRGLDAAHARFASMDWSELVAPAIARAEAGFVVRPHMHDLLSQDEGRYGRLGYMDKLRFSDDGRRIYLGSDGAAPRPGEQIRNGDMAGTLRLIAEHGASAFYVGELAEAMVADIQAHGGLLALDDLAGYRVRSGSPLAGSYRGLDVCSSAPPGGGVMLIEMLNVLEHFEVAAFTHNDCAHMSVLAEAMKTAIIDKEAHVGDPQVADICFEKLTGRAHAADVAARIKAGEQVQVRRLPTGQISKSTSHVSVLDRHGNAVSLTHSLGLPSGVITPGLGFMFNGGMASFDPRPGRPNSIRPGSTRFGYMAPTMVYRDGRPLLSLGAPGGPHIPNALLQVILNVVDFGMSITDAVIAPRMSMTGNVLEVSSRIAPFQSDPLVEQGYTVQRSHAGQAFGAVSAIHDDDGNVGAASDPQRDGLALVL